MWGRQPNNVSVRVLRCSKPWHTHKGNCGRFTQALHAAEAKTGHGPKARQSNHNGMEQAKKGNVDQLSQGRYGGAKHADRSALDCESPYGYLQGFHSAAQDP
jgi:hypothetical protein